MRVLKAAVAVGAAAVTLLGARAALAATHGVVFIHGTGDSPGTMVCSGQSCTVSAAYGGSNYWEAGEVASIANGRPYAVVGFDGGSCAPWPQTGDSTYGHVSSGSACPLPTSTGNADVIVAQIAQFLATGITEIELVTHSGGSNQARYILQNYTRNANYTKVKNATVRVVTIAGTTLGTYLANEVFSGGITSLIGGLVGYGGEGVNMLRTNYISTYNGASSYFGGINNPVQGVNFYSTGGVSGTTCYGVTIFGACIGIKGPTLGGVLGACDSSIDDAALLVLHTLYLNTNDSSTNRNACSDGFISCMGSQRLGNTFSYAEKQDHNQSRRQCNNLDVAVRNTVSGYRGFSDFGAIASEVSPHQLDACGFGVYAPVQNSNHQTIAWTEGCTKSQLGNGNCDWDCVALYGNDAVVTQWDSTGTKPLAWGASDCTASTETYNGVTYATASTDPFAESGTYTNSSGTFYTAFNGYTCTGTSGQCGGYNPSAPSSNWFYDPNYSSTTESIYGVGYCPQSWIGDGTCDECVMALYGSDGNDCAPGHITQCGGIVTGSQPYKGSSYYYYNNALYNEGTPSSGGQSWLEWQSMPAVANDGVCENTECGKSYIGATGQTSSAGYVTSPTAQEHPVHHRQPVPRHARVQHEHRLLHLLHQQHEQRERQLQQHHLRVDGRHLQHRHRDLLRHEQHRRRAVRLEQRLPQRLLHQRRLHHGGERLLGDLPRHRTHLRDQRRLQRRRLPEPDRRQQRRPLPHLGRVLHDRRELPGQRRHLAVQLGSVLVLEQHRLQRRRDLQ